MRFPFVAAGLGAALALSACTPRTQPGAGQPGGTVQASVTTAQVGFYPLAAGLVWTYLPEGDSREATPYVLRGLGPTIFAGQTVQAAQLTGRGADQTWFRTVDANGTWLHGFRKPGVVALLSPPWQEWPAEGAWRAGLSWSGESRLTLQDDNGRVQAQGKVSYRYDVQGRQQVRVGGEPFEVWVVSRQLRGDLGDFSPQAQQLWFAPGVGEVRTAEGLLLTSRNFAPRGGQR